MALPDRLRVVTFHATAANWLQRVLLGMLGLVVIVTAFFFLTVALIAGALLAVVIAVRWWWLMRELRARQAASAALEGQYTVVEDANAPDRPQDR